MLNTAYGGNFYYYLTADLTTETTSGRVMIEKSVDIATSRPASSESRLNLDENRAHDAATGAPNITARVIF